VPRTTSGSNGERDAAGGPSPDDSAQGDASLLGEFVPDLTDLLEKLLGVGAALTRTVAQAAEPGRATTGSGPLDEMVRNGASALANLVRLTVDSLRASTQAPAPPGQRAPGREPTPRPSVRAGDTLRMPLFIENPAPEPTGPLHFAALRARYTDPGDGGSFPLSRVRCSPKVLEIDARDFEKVTVFVDTTPKTRAGRLEVEVGVADTAFVTTVELDILPAR